MRPTPAKIKGFELYPATRPGNSPYVHLTVQLHPELQPGGGSVDSVQVDTIVKLDPSSDSIGEINKRAAASIHAAIQRAAQLSIEDVERAISHALEYDEHRA